MCDLKVVHLTTRVKIVASKNIVSAHAMNKGPGEWLAGTYSPRSSHSTLPRVGRFISSLGMRLSICVSEFSRLAKSSALVTYMPPFQLENATGPAFRGYKATQLHLVESRPVQM